MHACMMNACVHAFLGRVHCLLDREQDARRCGLESTERVDIGQNLPVQSPGIRWRRRAMSSGQIICLHPP